MPKPVTAPEIFQIPLSEVDPAIAPASASPGTPEFDQAVIMHYVLRYAEKGWQAMVTVSDGFVRVLAIPQQGMDPKEYVLGLLNNRFLEDALPILQALDGMLDDPEIAYNYGICLSELGKVEECIEPLERCTRLDPAHANAWVGLGVAHTRLGHADKAMAALAKALEIAPDNPYALRNLGGVLMQAERYADALPHLRQAATLAPDDVAAQLGLAQCLEALGGDHRKEADGLYSEIVIRFPDHPLTERARQARTRIAQANLRAGGDLRMDAVFYMQDALERFAGMSQAEVGQVTMEIALLGRQGLHINDPDSHRRLKSMEGEFSDLHLLCLMHAGVRHFDPRAETGTNLDKEYDVAKTMRGNRP